MVLRNKLEELYEKECLIMQEYGLKDVQLLVRNEMYNGRVRLT